jgi:ABC-2 type transport system ATP-binding protein
MIEIEHLTKVYGTRKSSWKLFKSHKIATHSALSDITLSVSNGQILGIIGPNGAGKSTLIKLVAGIIQPTSGSVKINDYYPKDNFLEHRLSLAIVFGQRNRLLWDLPLRRSLYFFCTLYRVKKTVQRQKVEAAIADFDLHEFIDQPVRQLSLGQRMRGELAANFLYDPKVVLLDEPTIGLDFESRDKLRNSVKNAVSQRKCSVILTSHDLEDVKKMADRIALLNRGSLIFQGTVDEMMRTYGSRQILRIQSDMTCRPTLSNGIFQMSESVNLFENEVEIVFDTNAVKYQDILREFWQKHEITQFSLEVPSIEDALRMALEESKRRSTSVRV